MPSPLDYITGIGSLVGTGASLGYNIWSTNENNSRNERLIQRQNRMNIAQWRRENNYNLPINQIGRMEQAGLNPNLMYGEGAGSMLSAPSPQMESSQGKAPQVDPLTSSQVALNLAQAEKIKGENQREEEKQPLTLRHLEVEVDSLTQSIKESNSNIAKNSSEMAYYDELSKQAKEETSKLHQEYLYLRDSMESRLEDIKNVAEKHGFESKKLSYELDVYKDMLKKQLDLMDKQAKLYVAEAFSARSHVNTYKNSVEYDRQFRNRGLKQWGLEYGLHNKQLRLSAFEADTKRRELEGQLERWDDMTTNERIKMVLEFSETIMEIGSDFYTRKSSSKRK